MSNKPTVNVRIKHKYDTYKNWINSSLILEPGELAIAKIENGDNSLTPPTIGIKVGNGLKPFSELDWIQAIAGDVNSWAKESAPENLLNFTDNAYAYPKFITELKNFISTNTGDTTYTFEWIKDQLVITPRIPSTDGSYTNGDPIIIDIKSSLDKKVDKLVVDENYDGGDVLTLSTDGGLVKSGTKLSSLATTDTLNSVAEEISNIATRNETAITLLNSAADVEGSVKYQIAQEIVKLQGPDLEDKFDTLKEIVDYITKETDAEDALTLLGRVNKNVENINKNAKDIAELQTALGDGVGSSTGLLKEVADIKANITDNIEPSISQLESTVGDAESGLVQKVNTLESTVGDSNGGLVKEVEGLAVALEDAVTSVQVSSVPASSTEEYVTKTDKTATINAIPMHLLTNSTIEGFTLIFDCGNADGFTSNKS